MIVTVGFVGWLLSGMAIAPIRTSYQQLKQFTADASHELRNPIAVIQTNVQVALADPDEQFQRTQLQVVERLTRRLGRLVDDLLFLARQESGLIPIQKEPVDLSQLLKEVIEEQQAIAQEKHLILTYTPYTAAERSRSRSVSTGESPIHGDPTQLTRLFTNLIANAIQYTPTGSITLTTTESNNQIKTTITDTGIGIPEKDLAHIFDRFYRVDPARSRNTGKNAGGSGLGLAIAKIITENHQGTLTLTSEVASDKSTEHGTSKHGTTVTVTLPKNNPPQTSA
ncbi:MAG: HAMP domain-containing sensor histidine kinase [Cyanobacteria bacterium J06632_3]